MSENPFQPGDRADHKSGALDSREVAKVEGDMIWLWFFTETPAGPFYAADYDRIPKAVES